MKLAVILPAAGASRRYTQSGGLRSKLDEDLGTKPVLQRSIELFTKLADDVADVAAIIVAGPHADADFADFRQRHGDRLGLLGVTLCRGGATHRWETVQSALTHVPADITHIAVHDAARPCTPPELIARILSLAPHYAGVVPALPVGDTLKRVRVTTEPERRSHDAVAAILGVDDSAGPRRRVVQATVPRTDLFAVQTPQVFRADLLRSAYVNPPADATDDAEVVAQFLTNHGATDDPLHQVIITDGDPRNLKVTSAGDLPLARAILGVRPPEERAAHKRF